MYGTNQPTNQRNGARHSSVPPSVPHVHPSSRFSSFSTHYDGRGLDACGVILEHSPASGLAGVDRGSQLDAIAPILWLLGARSQRRYYARRTRESAASSSTARAKPGPQRIYPSRTRLSHHVLPDQQLVASLALRRRLRSRTIGTSLAFSPICRARMMPIRI